MDMGKGEFRWNLPNHRFSVHGDASLLAPPPQADETLQLRLAEITEMIHAASLFHDDVIDEADTRRGVPSVNKVFGNKLAILAGKRLVDRW